MSVDFNILRQLFQQIVPTVSFANCCLIRSFIRVSDTNK